MNKVFRKFENLKFKQKGKA